MCVSAFDAVRMCFRRCQVLTENSRKSNAYFRALVPRQTDNSCRVTTIICVAGGCTATNIHMYVLFGCMQIYIYIQILSVVGFKVVHDTHTRMCCCVCLLRDYLFVIFGFSIIIALWWLNFSFISHMCSCSKT